MTPEKIAASCEGKQAFETYDDAMRVAKRRKRRRKGPITVAPYRCGHCRKFHLARPK